MNHKNKSIFILLTLGLVLSSCDLTSEDRDQFSGVIRTSINDYYIEGGVNHLKQRTKGKWYSPTSRGQNTISLTFDDGPGPYTEKLLDILASWNQAHPENQIQATFFALGMNIKSHESTAIRMIQEGHNLASHDWDHNDNNLESENSFKLGMSKTVREIDRIYQLAGETYRHGLFRFPFGNYGKAKGYHHFDSMLKLGTEVFGDNCFNYVFWDLDTSDWVKGISATQVAQNLFAFLPASQDKTFYDRQKVEGKWQVVPRTILKTEIGGGVALLHDTHLNSVQAVELFLSKVENHNQMFIDSPNKQIQFINLLELAEYAIPEDKDCRIRPLL